MAFRIESNTYNGSGGQRIRETRFRNFSNRETRDIEDGSQLLATFLCGKTQSSGEKKCRIITWTVIGAGTGAGIGSAAGGVGAIPGAILGGMIGMGIGTCTIL